MTVEKQVQYIYVATQGMRAVYLYAARQRMRAVYMHQDRGCGHATIITCVTPPYISFIMGLCMLLLLHALIPCLAAYILPSSSVLLHISTTLIPCIYTALVSLLFGTVIPTSFNILMEMFLLPCYDNTLHHCLLSHAHNCLSVCLSNIGIIFSLDCPHPSY